MRSNSLTAIVQFHVEILTLRHSDRFHIGEREIGPYWLITL